MKCTADYKIKRCNFMGHCCEDCPHDELTHSDCHVDCKNYHPYKQVDGKWIFVGCKECEYCKID